MKNKISIETILERIEAKIKKVGYHIRREEKEISYNYIEVILEDLSNVQTLLNRETQD